jgi:protein CrcB
VISYLWIGLGGAFGSIARAWLAVALARITGPQFPWGTILINVVGSFVIGFFGTLTANDSRFAVPVDVRAFVMVGVCGGFTTFSSFSLQTLELARDGRMLQALCNVGLSVVLCLAAVTAGHASAVGLHRTRPAAMRQIISPGPGVLVILNRPADTRALLDAAARLLGLTGGKAICAVAVRMPPAAMILPSEEVMTAERAAAIRAEQENWASRLHQQVRTWAEPREKLGIRTEWLDQEGDAAELVAEYGVRADTVVVARPARDDTQHARDCLHAALFATGKPTLLLPPRHRGVFGQTVAIAWKDDACTRAAVEASLPILRAADAVHVLCADQPPRSPPVLAEHGMRRWLHSVPEGPGSLGERLLASAREVGADLLVMGAFTHGEWREEMFGGVTRTVLSDADLPVFMRH